METPCISYLERYCVYIDKQSPWNSVSYIYIYILNQRQLNQMTILCALSFILKKVSGIHEFIDSNGSNDSDPTFIYSFTSIIWTSWEPHKIVRITEFQTNKRINEQRLLGTSESSSNSRIKSSSNYGGSNYAIHAVCFSVSSRN